MKYIITDEELVALIKTDASKGIAMALDIYGGAVKTICHSFLNGFQNEDIEETISDVFIELWKSISHFHSEETYELKFYLYGIARNVAANRRRKLMKEKNLSGELDETMSDGQNLEEQVVKQWEVGVLEEMIQQFKDVEREIFIARYYEEKQIKDIAKQFGMTPKSVENRLARGKEKLKKELRAKGVSV